MHYHLVTELWLPQAREELERNAHDEHRRREAAGALRVRVEERSRHRRQRVPRASVVVRLSRAGDDDELARLGRDPELEPSTDYVVAERSGSLLAAVALADGDQLVDPRAGADVIALVRLRARQLRDARDSRAA